jgi:septation ring formation regulator EzrA
VTFTYRWYLKKKHQGKSRRLHEFRIALLPISYNRQSSQVKGMDLEGEKKEKAQLLAKKKKKRGRKKKDLELNCLVL